MTKTQKEGNNIQRFKKREKKEKENRTRMTGPSHNNTKAKGKKKQTQRTKNCAKRGYVATKKPATTNSAKLEMEKWVKKNNKNKQTTQPKRENKNIYTDP